MDREEAIKVLDAIMQEHWEAYIATSVTPISEKVLPSIKQVWEDGYIAGFEIGAQITEKKMFVIVYKPSEPETNEWRVDTAEDGSVSSYEELSEALDRMNKIRSLGAEACLTVIIE